MASIKPVSFTSPGHEYSADLMEIERRRRLAQMLDAQSAEEIKPAQGGRFVVPISPWQGMAKIAQGAAGGIQAARADQQHRALAERVQGDYRSSMAGALRKLQGTPASSETIMDEQARGGEGAPATINTPALAPDPFGAMEAAARSPMAAQLVNPLAMQAYQQQHLVNALRGVGTQGAGTGGTPPAGGEFNALDPNLINLSMLPGGAGPAKLISDRQIASQKAGLDREKFSRAIFEWDNLSASQRAELAQKGVKNALDLAEARDKGIDVSAITTPSMGVTAPPKPGTPEAEAYQAVASGRVPTAYVPQTQSAPAGVSPRGAREAADASLKAYQETSAKGAFERDNAQYEAASSAVENIVKLDTMLGHLKTSSAITGVGAELLKDVERMKVFVANNKAAGKAVSDTELLNAFLGSDVFPMIKALGIGARGLDTPAEREFLREVMSGTIQMNKDTLVRLTQFRKDIAERAIKKFNDRVQTGEMDRFFSSSGIQKRGFELQKPNVSLDELLKIYGR